jgi:hypothetical protein
VWICFAQKGVIRKKHKDAGKIFLNLQGSSGVEYTIISSSSGLPGLGDDDVIVQLSM